MDLNQIQFSKEQLTELFTEQLVVIESQTVEAQKSLTKKGALEKATIPFKGKNKKNMLWAIYEPEQAYLTDSDFDFLSQILTACKMNMDDIALVNFAKGNFTVIQTAEELNAQIILLCGLPGSIIPAVMKEYNLVPYQKRNYFLCDSLQALRNDKVMKSKLWTALKDILSL